MKKKQLYKLPRGYISWSQVDLVERDPMEYIRSYIEHSVRYESPEMMFGKRFAEAMEQGECEEDPVVDFLVKHAVPKFELVEYEIKDVAYKGIPLLGRMDSISPDLMRFRDTKTGKEPWTQGKVDSHGQFAYYALLIFLKTGKLPEECWVDWVGTKNEYGEIRATGRVQTLQRKPFGMLEVSAIGKRIEKAAKTITGLVDDWRHENI